MPTLGRTTGLSKPKIHIDSATTATAAPEAPRKWVNRKVPVSAIVVVGFGVLVAVAVGIVLLVGILGNTKNTSELLQDKGESVVNLVERDIRARLSPAMAQSAWIARSFSDGDVGIDDLHRLDAFMFGALAGTPQLAGLAVITPNGQSRRWTQHDRAVIQEDWSDDEALMLWLKAGADQTEAGWRPPFWTDSLNTAVVMLDTPLRLDGQFVGMLAQVVPIAEISTALAGLRMPDGMTPFVLYKRDRVLAHPKMVDWRPQAVGGEVPLPDLKQFGDQALQRIWTPDQDSIFMLRNIQGVAATGSVIGDDFHIFLSKELKAFGEWTIGVYFNTNLTGSDEYNRLIRSMWAGLIVLVIAVLLAAKAGKRISVPVQQLANAALEVETRGLDAAPTVPPSRVRELDDASRSFNKMVRGLQEQELIRRTLGRFVPEEVAQSLLSAGGELEVSQAQATVLFCDLEGFTSLTEQVGPQGIMSLLNEYFEDMVSTLERHHGVVTQFQGDAILATFNVPIEDPEHANKALQAALEMNTAVSAKKYAGHSVNHRIGINTGPVVAGAVGATGRLSYTVHGDAVNLASRLESLNKEYGSRILVSEHTVSLSNGFNFRRAGSTTVRGQSKPVELFELCATATDEA